MVRVIFALNKFAVSARKA